MCEQREQILDYLYDEASPTGRREVERHLEGCDECRDEIRAFRNVREDLLAWGVPNPPSVWTAFAPAPPVPWHKQVPAWAMAAAASLMFVVGTAGGFVAHSVVDGSSAPAATAAGSAAVPAQLTQASLIDAKAIVALIREELANTGRDLTVSATPVNNMAGPAQLDPRVEARLVSRMTELVDASHMRQLSMVGDYLYKVRQEDEVRRRDDGMRLGLLAAQLEQLEAQLKQVALAQAKVQ